MRTFGLLALIGALVLAAGAWAMLHSDPDVCTAFGSDLELAITAPTKAPDPDDHTPLGYGGCNYAKTKKFEAKLFGAETHRELTIGGSLYVSGGMHAGALGRIKSRAKEESGKRIVPLPKLGQGAFLAIADGTATGVVPDPTRPAAPVPTPSVTAYWRRGTTLFSASANRDGARLDEDERSTARLAELINRRPVRDLSE